MRVQLQNEKPISVIIGNPPYNDSATSWGDGGANREYPEIDRRITRDLHQREHGAEDHTQYDMYKRFIRWASDRLDDDGIIGFITNRSYLDSRQDDGFRKLLPKRVQLTPTSLTLARTCDIIPRPQEQLAMYSALQTGVAIAFLVRDIGATG